MRGISITASSFLLFLASFSPAFAQVLWFHPQPPTVLSATCISIPTNMRIGATDASTAGAVSVLQTFLAEQGYFSAAYLGTGRFGPLTHSALVRYQAASGLPATGYFGPLTRAAIEQRTCGGGVVVPPPQTTPVLYGLNPNQTFVGATVQITGYGFTEDNTIYMDGSIVARGVPTSSTAEAVCAVSDPWCYGGGRQTLLFTVPSALSPYCPPGLFCAQYMRQVTPGNYAITVQNRNGTSNALTLTVTSSGGSGTISINGLDAPSSLTIGQTGTWTVRASVPNYSGNLRYSVLWGDEGYTANGIMMPQSTTIQTSATFTHAYQYSGVYTPRFTVTDDWGGSVTTSATVQVNPIY